MATLTHERDFFVGLVVRHAADLSVENAAELARLLMRLAAARRKLRDWVGIESREQVGLGAARQRAEGMEKRAREACETAGLVLITDAEGGTMLRVFSGPVYADWPIPEEGNP